MTKEELIEVMRKNPSSPFILLLPESRAVQRKMGLVSFKPALGWTKTDCEVCGQKSWIGLKQKALKEAQPEVPAVCLPCGVKYGADLSNMQHLGGRSGEYQMEDGSHFGPDTNG